MEEKMAKTITFTTKKGARIDVSLITESLGLKDDAPVSPRGKRNMPQCGGKKTLLTGWITLTAIGN